MIELLVDTLCIIYTEIDNVLDGDVINSEDVYMMDVPTHDKIKTTLGNIKYKDLKTNEIIKLNNRNCIVLNIL